VGWLVLGLPAALRQRNLPALLLLLALTGLHGERPRFGRLSPIPERAIRVVTWNVSTDRAAWSTLRSLDADVVAVQESAGPPHPIWEGYTWHGGSDPGVLTRFPTERLPTRSVGPWSEPLLLSVSPQGRAPFLLVNVRLSLPSVVVWVAGGFEDPLPSQAHALRVGQYARLAALIQETRINQGVESVVIVGDFNVPPRMPSLGSIRDRFLDCWDAAGRGWGATATAELPLARIDHCWASPDVEIAAARTARGPVSDHRMLVVDLVLSQSPLLD
jgi:endonuclease/exonuclease/phosphatase (EEP) superfamily protein YafD